MYRNTCEVGVAQECDGRDAQQERAAFWTTIRPKPTKPKGGAAFLLEGRKRVAQRVLTNREGGRCTTLDAWRYFDALAVSIATPQKGLALVRWAECTLPTLAAEENLRARLQALRGKRLSNAEYGRLLQLTRAQREAYGITRRFVTECDLTPEQKRKETLERKEKRRKAETRRRRAKGIQARPFAGWRLSGGPESKRTFYRRQAKRRQKQREWGEATRDFAEANSPSIESLGPWRIEGMSRRTWFNKSREWREESYRESLSYVWLYRVPGWEHIWRGR